MKRGRTNVQLFFVVIAMAAAAGLARDLRIYFPRGGLPPPWHVDGRYTSLAGKLPADQRLGFLTDATQDEAAGRHFAALYAFAPRIIGPGLEQRYVIADLKDPAALAALCARWHLRIVLQGDLGMALLEHE
jgi:hypothetical protein